MTSSYKGLFITIEGADGVGKSTFCLELKHLLEKEQIRPVLTTAEPGGSLLADKIRQIFLSEEEPLSPLTELFLISASRQQHLQQTILPKLKQNYIILCDRFYDSTRVYQSLYADIEESYLEKTIANSIMGQQPQVTFLLDCPFQVSQKRLLKRRTLSRFDRFNLSKHDQIRQAFLKLYKKNPTRIVYLDTRETTENIIKKAYNHLILNKFIEK